MLLLASCWGCPPHLNNVHCGQLSEDNLAAICLYYLYDRVIQLFYSAVIFVFIFSRMNNAD